MVRTGLDFNFAPAHCKSAEGKGELREWDKEMRDGSGTARCVRAQFCVSTYTTRKAGGEPVEKQEMVGRRWRVVVVVGARGQDGEVAEGGGMNTSTSKQLATVILYIVHKVDSQTGSEGGADRGA